MLTREQLIAWLEQPGSPWVKVEDYTYEWHRIVRRYGQWAGNPRGVSEDPKRCAAEVPATVGIGFYQCQRRRTVGEFCKQHSKRKVSVPTPVQESRRWELTKTTAFQLYQTGPEEAWRAYESAQYGALSIVNGRLHGMRRH